MTVTVQATIGLVVAPRRSGWGAVSASFEANGGGYQIWSAPSAVADVLTIVEDFEAWVLATLGEPMSIYIDASDTSPAVVYNVSNLLISGASAQAQELLGWPSGTASFSAEYVTSGLIAGRTGGIDNWHQEAPTRQAAAQGAPSPQPPGTSPYRPTLAGSLSAAMAPYALAALQAAATPRVARVWDAGDAVWRTVSLGAVRVARATPALHVLTADVLG